MRWNPKTGLNNRSHAWKESSEHHGHIDCSCKSLDLVSESVWYHLVHIPCWIFFEKTAKKNAKLRWWSENPFFYHRTHSLLRTYVWMWWSVKEQRTVLEDCRDYIDKLGQENAAMVENFKRRDGEVVSLFIDPHSRSRLMQTSCVETQAVYIYIFWPN